MTSITLDWQENDDCYFADVPVFAHLNIKVRVAKATATGGNHEITIHINDGASLYFGRTSIDAAKELAVKLVQDELLAICAQPLTQADSLLKSSNPQAYINATSIVWSVVACLRKELAAGNTKALVTVPRAYFEEVKAQLHRYGYHTNYVSSSHTDKTDAFNVSPYPLEHKNVFH